MYDNGTKETWRGWAWNQISMRCPAKSKIGVFCGDVAADYEVATKKGFTPVGVDIVENCVTAFRKKGGVAIHEDVTSVVRFFDFDGFILDELGGVTKSSAHRLKVVQRGCFAVVANYLRGRDSTGADLCRQLNFLTVPIKNKSRHMVRLPINKHRGLIAWVFTNVLPIADFEFCFDAVSLTRKIASFSYKERLQVLVDYFAKESNIQVFSYRSKDSGQYFDSVAYSNKDAIDSRDSFREVRELDMRVAKYHSRLRKIKNKAAAAKALITTRLNNC